MGTAHGEFTLPADARPGYYSIMTSADDYSYLGFQVASYRKPEINLQVSFTDEQALAGDTLSALVNARYFFDAPAGNVKLHWALYQASSYFGLPGYKVGPEDTSWMEVFRFPNIGGELGNLVDEGDGVTSPDGTLLLDFPTEPSDARLRYTLEVTITDESGLPVSARGSIEVNPDQFYIGLRSDAWVGRSGEPVNFDVQLVDWLGQPDGAQNLRAEFQKVKWNQVEPEVGRSLRPARMGARIHTGRQHRFHLQRRWPGPPGVHPSRPRHLHAGCLQPRGAGRPGRAHPVVGLGRRAGPGRLAKPAQLAPAPGGGQGGITSPAIPHRFSSLTRSERTCRRC